MGRSRRAGRPRLVTPVFLLVTLANFAYFVSVGCLTPTLPRYVAGPLGGGDVQVGLAFGAFTITALLLRPVAGRLGDRRGRRLLIVAGGAVHGLSVLGYIPADGLVALVGFRLVTGIGEAFFFVGAASAINDLAPDERRGEAISLFSLSLYSGTALGPVLGEWVLGDGHFDRVWLLSAAFAAAAVLLAIRVPDTRAEPTPSGGGGRLAHPAAFAPGIVLGASVWALAGYNSFVPLYALQVGLGGSRFLFVTFSVTVLLVRSIGARLPDVLGPSRTAKISLASTAVAMAVLGTWGQAAGLYAGTVLFGLGQALAFPALMTIALATAPASERGAVIGTFTAFFDLAFGVGAPTLGGIAEALGYGGAFLAASGVAVAGALFLFVRFPAVRGRPPTEPVVPPL